MNSIIAKVLIFVALQFGVVLAPVPFEPMQAGKIYGGWVPNGCFTHPGHTPETCPSTLGFQENCAHQTLFFRGGVVVCAECAKVWGEKPKPPVSIVEPLDKHPMLYTPDPSPMLFIPGGGNGFVRLVPAPAIISHGDNSVISPFYGFSADPKTCKHQSGVTSTCMWFSDGIDRNQKTCMTCGADLTYRDPPPVQECQHKHVICLPCLPPREICQDCGKELK